MMIDQRNAGAAVTVSANVYTLDRWLADEGGMNAFTVQQSTTAPTGFKNSLKCTMGTAVTIDATDYAFFRQSIEGYNVYDLNLGSASSSAFTLSFWVQSSVTGTFGVSFRNNAATATWCSTYTISAANTWEYKTVSVAAGAINSGTWTTDNTAGLAVFWDLGVGSTYSGTANQLNTGANYFGVTGTTKLASTTGATFYITGVQLEKGSTATSFDYRPYGTELALCQRYYEEPLGYTRFNGTSGVTEGCAVNFAVTKRAAPTMAVKTIISNVNTSAVYPSDFITTSGNSFIVTASSTALTQYAATLSATAEL
jgi:hypothetical protein